MAKFYHCQNQPSSPMAAKGLKDFNVVNDELSYQGSVGVLARGLSFAEAKKELQ